MFLKIKESNMPVFFPQVETLTDLKTAFRNWYDSPDFYFLYRFQGPAGREFLFADDVETLEEIIHEKEQRFLELWWENHGGILTRTRLMDLEVLKREFVYYVGSLDTISEIRL